MVRKTLGVLVAALAMAGSVAVAQTGSTVTGTWIMDNGKITVHVSECGGSLCGRIVGMKQPLDGHGRPKRDKENPNPALRDRPMIGLTVLSNMKPSGEGRWKGKIYNPDDGNTYTSKMKLQGANLMKVEGCVAGILCKAMKFKRVN